MTHAQNTNGWQIYIAIWFGQFVSMVGTAMTRFALLIWAYQHTGQATTLALLGFFTFTSYILSSPFAGNVVDHFSRRWVMIFSDLGAGLTTAGLLILVLTDHMHIGFLFSAQIIIGVCQAFQTPAYKAAVTVLMPKAQYTRANALWSLAESMGDVFAPLIAGVLLLSIGLAGILLLDIITFALAMGALLIVKIPDPVPADFRDGVLEKQSIWTTLGFGIQYIRQRKGLTLLLLIFVGINFFAATTYLSILPVLILARSGGAELTLASVQTALGLGGVMGGIVLLVWGGPKRLIHGVLAGAAASFFLGDILFAIGRGLTVWMIAAFSAAVFVPMILSSYRSIWQKKVAPHAQGRVFAAQGMFQQLGLPIGYLIAGPLADRVFEPAMASGGFLSKGLGWLVGLGPGAGIAVMFLCTAVFGMLISLSGYLIPAVRNIESDIPDYDSDVVSI